MTIWYTIFVGMPLAIGMGDTRIGNPSASDVDNQYS